MVFFATGTHSQVHMHEGALTLVLSQQFKDELCTQTFHSQSPHSHAMEADIMGMRECHAQQTLTVSYRHFPDVISLSRLHL